MIGVVVVIFGTHSMIVNCKFWNVDFVSSSWDENIFKNFNDNKNGDDFENKDNSFIIKKMLLLMV